ncbi:SpoIID/LytB domain-containing protein [Azotosporobacter soli]|uniref:SpoIID/LytB domain-containing protein n=1 Tax=Azotosporobacter soli TaxID=3055040 RepID=UPI0031FF0D72
MRLILRRSLRILCLTILCVATLFITPAAAAEQMIRVGLAAGQNNVTFTSEGSLEVLEQFTGKTVLKLSANQSLAVAFDPKGQLLLNGKVIETTALRLRTNTESMIALNRQRYRGEIELLPKKGGRVSLTIVNVLPMEQYLYGIIAREISPDWAREAVKAQAVAARTYALYSLNKHGKDGYDVCSGTDCQVYGGRNAESASGNAAVDATRGEVMLYNGRPIAAYFHSSSGGYTESSDNVWGGNSPYIKGVLDFDQESPYYSWDKQVSSSVLEGKLKKAGYSIGRLSGIELSVLPDKRPLPDRTSADRAPSGRVKALTLISESGRKEISGNQLRSILGLNSTLFDITIIETRGNGKPDAAAKAGALHRLTPGAEQMVRFNGYGWGHGLGMSQWGAKAMAEKAPLGDGKYYQTILRHYYSGIEIRKTY